MGSGAYILIAGSSAAEDRSAMLEKAGYRCSVAPAGADPARTVAEANPNVALIGAGDRSGLEVVRRLKSSPESRHIPVVAVDVGHGPEALRACYDAGADDLFESDAEETEILARLVALVRLSGMEAEMLRRAETAGDFGIAVDTKVDVALPDSGFRLLVVGVEQDEFDAMCPMLSKTGISYAAEADPYRARSRLRDEKGKDFAGALVYVQGGEPGEKCAFFCRSVRNDRRLFDLPLFVVAEAGAFRDAADAYGHGASVFVRMPIDCDFVDVHLRMLYRGRALRRALGKRINSALDTRSADKLGNVYSSEFIQAHLQRLDRDAVASGRQSAAILFFVPTIGEVAAMYGEDAASRLRQQLADWLSSLVRVEDIVARTGSDEFLMLLPETAQDDAEIVRARVTGVLQQSEFRLTDNVPVGIEVFIQSALATVEPGETVDTLVARASAALA
jgi:two-component system cell cycle response regulator